jgi:hypothetical protein
MEKYDVIEVTQTFPCHPEIAMGPYSATQPNPIHHFLNPPHQNPNISDQPSRTHGLTQPMITSVVAKALLAIMDAASYST